MLSPYYPSKDKFNITGWVCYAEKTHGTFILPYISTVRSPQQVMGSLVKDMWARQKDITPDKVKDDFTLR